MPALIVFSLLESTLQGALPAWFGGALMLVAALLGARMATRQGAAVELMLLEGQRLAWSTAAGRHESPGRLDERWPWFVVRTLPSGPAWVFWPDTMDAPRRRILRRWSRAAASSPLPQFWVG